MMLKGIPVAEAFYPFVENGGNNTQGGTLEVSHQTRIAVYDDAAAAPRVVVVEPKDIRSYLEEITGTTVRLAQEQGGRIPFMVVREVVENLIHAYFREPTISILDGGNTIRFSDQGPGIQDKQRALQYGTTSATEEMRAYIRGVGSGLPYAQQWLEDKGGSLTIEDNIHQGTVVTISLARGGAAAQVSQQGMPQAQQGFYQQQQTPAWGQAPMAQQAYAAGYPANATMPQPTYPYQAAPQYPQPAYPPQGYVPQGYPAQWSAPAAGWQQPYAPQAATQMAPQVSERGRVALQYLMTHESVGPRDLNTLQPLSEATWSRELSQLEEQGLISKQGGRKRKLTQAGRQFLGMQ